MGRRNRDITDCLSVVTIYHLSSPHSHPPKPTVLAPWGNPPDQTDKIFVVVCSYWVRVTFLIFSNYECPLFLALIMNVPFSWPKPNGNTKRRTGRPGFIRRWAAWHPRHGRAIPPALDVRLWIRWTTRPGRWRRDRSGRLRRARQSLRGSAPPRHYANR
jgi:hypothetical protein